MMNMRNEKTKRIVSAVIIGIIIVTMVLPMGLAYLV